MRSLTPRLGRAAALIIASGFLAHAAGDGALSVSVTDASGKAIAGATVTISSPTQIGGARTATTDSTGRARFLRLSPGTFKIQLSASGFQAQTITNIDVLVDQTAAVNAKLVPVGGATVEVVAGAAQVDTTTVTQGTQISDVELERLPVQRNQLSTLNLAPGVVASTSGNGNPALAVGLNRDNLGGNGARNNTYMIDGIDVTSPEAGTLRTAIAPELIQVQDVKTGAITAEYSARAGLFSSVTTKAGGNDFSAGLTAAFAPGSLQGSVAPGRFDVAERNVTDLSVWAMGPIIKDKLWYVISAQKVKDEVTVKLNNAVASTPGESRKGLNEDGKRFFGKLTWQITPSDLLSLTFNSNPFEFDNLSNPGVVTRRAAKTEQGGNRYILTYSHQWEKVFLDFRYAVHNEDNKITALYTANGPQNTIRSSSALTALQAQLGNSSALDKREYKKDLGRLDVTWLFEAAGSHTLKAGVQFGNEQLTQTVGVGQNDQFDSYDVGTYTWGTVPSSTFSGAKSVTITAINNSATLTQQFLNAGFVRTGTGGTKFVSSDLNAYVFNEANPFGGFYSYRIHQVSVASSTPKMETQGFYAQDQWQMGRLTFSPGVRFDKYEFKADNGVSLFKTDYNVAPRVGLTYDVSGNGRSKAYAYWGRYIDPIKLDMVRFTGSLTSSERWEQVRLFNQWVTVITRGGTKVVDAVFADTFKLPKTDEFRIGFQTEFAGNYTFEATYSKRRDYDIVEDWDPTLYTDADNLEAEARGLLGLSSSATPSSAQQAIINRFRGLRIDPNYFAGGGFTGAQNVNRVATGQLNFVLANLPGGERKYRSLDLTVTRREANHWGGFASVSLVNAKGNSQSSGNADFQGDLAQFDPRLPYTNGRLEGSVDWLAKAYGYYRWDMGLMVGMAINANSGYHYTSPAFVASTRVLQSFPGAGEFYSEGLGNRMTPMFYQADLRAQYGRNFGKIRGEIYVDVINFTNRQEATDLSEGLNVRAVAPNSNTPYQFQAPRRYNFGIRIKY